MKNRLSRVVGQIRKEAGDKGAEGGKEAGAERESISNLHEITPGGNL
jgi:hypothetical protein